MKNACKHIPITLNCLSWTLIYGFHLQRLHFSAIEISANSVLFLRAIEMSRFVSERDGKWKVESVKSIEPYSKFMISNGSFSEQLNFVHLSVSEIDH